MAWINLLKILYSRNKLVFVLAVIALTLILAGCSSQAGSAPSGPIGGGCGG